MILRLLTSALCFTMVSCFNTDPNKDTYSEKVMDQNLISKAVPGDYLIADTVYVPIYSHIYSSTKDTRFLLTATLSIRNTSFKDTLFVSTIDYYDTRGALVREYLDQPFYLNPMATIDYVVDEQDDLGGSGANFIVTWSARNPAMKPLIQAIMISTNGQQGVSFSVDGVSIANE
ncbi:MAG: DUF3124 domain-containing protein [Cyclobacteriaceae bacterium]